MPQTQAVDYTIRRDVMGRDHPRRTPSNENSMTPEDRRWLMHKERGMRGRRKKPHLLVNVRKLKAAQYTTERGANYKANARTHTNIAEHRPDEKKDPETYFESAPEYSNEKGHNKLTDETNRKPPTKAKEAVENPEKNTQTNNSNRERSTQANAEIKNSFLLLNADRNPSNTS
jgi:hypothetical protein